MAGGLALEIKRDSGQILSMRMGEHTVSAGRGGVHLIDGKAKKVLPRVDPVELRSDESWLRLDWRVANGAIKGGSRIEARPDVILWHVDVENPTKQQQWLEVRLGLPVDPQLGWQYWDGRNLPVPVEPKSRILSARADPVLSDDSCTRLQSHYGLNFPMNCAWTEDTGLAVGLDPNTLHSYFAGGAEPGLSPADAVYYATKFVIDPGQSERTTFVILAFDPAYGFRGALERWYAAFPDVYRPDPQTDSRTLANCALGGTQLLFLGREFLWEDFRRLQMGWTWGTDAFYGGLCYPDGTHEQSAAQAKQSYWMFKHPYYKKPSWVKQIVAERGGLSAEEHRRYVREAFDGAADAIAVACNITSQYCRKEVADKEFRDSLLQRPNGSFVDIPKIHIMYAWGNRFGDTHHRLIREMLTSLQPPGVHFDNAVGYDHHYGNGVDQSPGRAFDVDKGKVYSFEGMAQAMHMQLARSFMARGQRVFVAANTVGTYFGARLCDVSLIESLGPWHDKTQPWRGKHTQPGFEHYLALRFLMGRKPLVFCGPYPWSAKLTDEEKKLHYKERNAVHLRKFEALTRDYPLFAYRVGAPTISYILRRYAHLREHSRTILKLCRAGWQPVPAARADAPSLWVERFGRGVGAYVTVGNPTDERVQATVTFDATCWGGAVAVATTSGAPVETVIENGTSHVKLDLAARAPIAWQVMALLAPSPPEGTVVKAATADEITRIDVDCRTSCRGTIRVSIAAGHELDSLTVNGLTQTCERHDSSAQASVALSPGKSLIEFRHRHLYRVADAAAQFPFFDGQKCQSTIVLRKDASPEERAVAKHLSRYFQYYFARRANPLFRPARLWEAAKNEHQIPIVDAPQAPATRLILIDQGDLPTELRGAVDVVDARGGRQVLRVRARSPSDLDRTLRRLLARLDTRYSL